MNPKRLRPHAVQAAIALSLIAAVAVFSPQTGGLSPTPAAADEVRRAYAIDGDTIEADGRRIRVANIDTPEMGDSARCAAERRLAQRATQRARALIDGANRVEAHPVGRIDRYGRTVAYVWIDGRDLGEALIAEGWPPLARPARTLVRRRQPPQPLTPARLCRARERAIESHGSDGRTCRGS